MNNKLALIDKEYNTWISQIKKLIRGTQIKASIAVNEEMLELYWNIGKDITEKSFEKNYGSKFFEKTSSELKTTFPSAQGFSERNLRYMKKFYMFYTEKLHQVGAESRTICHQLGDEFNAILFTIPWRHHIEIFTRAKSIDEALFFVSKTKENGWSRAMDCGKPERTNRYINLLSQGSSTIRRRNSENSFEKPCFDYAQQPCFGC